MAAAVARRVDAAEPDWWLVSWQFDPQPVQPNASRPRPRWRLCKSETDAKIVRAVLRAADPNVACVLTRAEPPRPRVRRS